MHSFLALSKQKLPTRLHEDPKKRHCPRPVVGSNSPILNHRAVGGHEVWASALPGAAMSVEPIGACPNHECEAAHSDIDCVSSAPEKVTRPARPERACGVATGFFPAAR